MSLKVIHRRKRTGFEETKDFPIRVNDLIAGRYQVLDDCSDLSNGQNIHARCLLITGMRCLQNILLPCMPHNSSLRCVAACLIKFLISGLDQVSSLEASIA